MSQTEISGQMSGFHTYTTTNESEFSDRSRRDLEEIIVKFTKLPKVQALLTFYDQVKDHLQDKTAHDLDMTSYQSELIRQLYRAYRDAGYTGDVGAMLKSIYKDIKVGTHADVQAGWSTTKALNAVEMRYILDQHSSDSSAHPELVATFKPDAIVYAEPIYHLSYLLNKNDSYLLDDGLTLDGWNDAEGTLYFSFMYQKETTNELFSLVGSDVTYTFTIAYTDTEATLHLTDGTNDNLILTLPYPTSGLDRIALTYDKDKLVFRDLVGSASFNRSSLVIHPVALKLLLPLSCIGSAEGIREIVYYNQAIASDDLNFFLN